MDQRAVEELSATLRTLLRDAATHQKLLSQNAGGIKAMADQATTLERDLKSRVEQAAQSTNQFDQRAARAQKLLEAAEQTIVSQVRAGRETVEKLLSPDLSTLEAHVLEIVERAAAEAQARIDAAAQEALEQTLAHLDAQFAARCEAQVLRAQADLGERIASLTTLAEATLTQIEHSAAEANTQRCHIEQLCEQGRALHALFDGQEARANELAHRLHNEITHADARRAQLTEAASQAQDRVGAALGRLDALLADFTSRFEQGAGEIETRLAQSAERGAQAAACLTQRADELASLAAAADVATLRHAVGDAQDALARSTEAALDLREASAGCDRAANDARQAAQGLRGILDQAAQAREAITTLDAIGPRVASLIERGNQIGQGLSRLLARAEQLSPPSA